MLTMKCLFDMFFMRQAKKDAKVALTRQGFKVPSSDDLSAKRVDPAKLEVSLLLVITDE